MVTPNHLVGDLYNGSISNSIVGRQGNSNQLVVHRHDSASGMFWLGAYARQARGFRVFVPAFDILCKHVATSALHNSHEVSEQPKCYPGTRVVVLDHLVAWATALSYAYPVK
ncbi:hypothetical protein CPB84DRAFT_1863441 [Gymnopilus junonius]|uniref:Uncharacterized protein n=1 Tax=Gymnopilus junonius TaxID=109634 RepID=A0A9P5TVA2_GYMJU|nr:hypothetical protein CPB84DRAFT_1863441 [Gymnopilus junonius]